MTCAHCRDASHVFTDRLARRELRRYRRRGPTSTTRRLLDAVRARTGGPGFTLLDIGGGVGAVQHELLADGASRVVSVDASPAYQALLRREAAARGTLDRLDLRLGDFVELAEDVPGVDVVTLDRVLCCYPDMPRLVEGSASRAGRLYGVVFPREHLPARLGIRLLNAWFALRGDAFRVYLHGTDRILETVERQGLTRVWTARSLLWQAHLFRRVPGTSPASGSGTAGPGEPVPVAPVGPTG